MNTDFVLPERWYIEITNDNREIVNNWKILQPFRESLLNNLNYKYVDCNGVGWEPDAPHIKSVFF